MKRKKVVSLMLAGTLAASALLAGTYAWKSVSQKAKNQVEQTVNPGARLHDDFDFLTGGNKDVYVENFTTEAESGVPVYARIRLDEYLEIGPNAGNTEREDDTDMVIVKNAGGTTPKLTEENTWTTYKWEREKLVENDQTPIKQNEPSEFRKYFLWNEGVEDETIYYMPTFNKNKDSLAADINGTLEGKDGLKTNPYDDNIVWGEGEELTSIAIYDIDDNDDEEADLALIEEIIDALTTTTEKQLKSGDYVEDREWDDSNIEAAMLKVVDEDPGDEDDGNAFAIDVVLNDDDEIEYIDVALGDDVDESDPEYNIRLKKETHAATATLSDGDIMSMEAWKKAGSKPGNYWVYDTDGWVYWANKIDPEEKTSLLLDKIGIRSETTIEEKYYYAINVIAQFCTKSEDAEWSDFDKEGAPSADAKKLLNNASGAAYEKYNVTITKTGGTETSLEAAQNSSVKLTAAVKEGTTAKTANISWSVEREDGKAIASGTTLESSSIKTENITLKIGIGEEVGKVLVVKATHMDENGCYGIGQFKVTVTEDSQLATIRQNIKTVAATVETGKYNADAKVTIDGVEWYVMATDNDAAPTQALLYAAASLDYDGTGSYGFADGFGNDNKWINSNIRKYLNGSFIAGNTAYEGKTFGDKYPYSFALAEPTKIYTRTSIDANKKNETEDFTDTTDKVFLLSESDFYGTFKGRYDSSISSYADIGAQSYDYTVRDSSGTEIRLWEDATNEQRKDATNGQWTWLRSPVGYDSHAASVYTSGNFTRAYCLGTTGALRPAFWVKLPADAVDGGGE